MTATTTTTYELRNVKLTGTADWKANLYKDGTKVASLRNHPRGGATIKQFDSLGELNAFESHAATLYPEVEIEPYEDYIYDLLEKAVLA